MKKILLLSFTLSVLAISCTDDYNDLPVKQPSSSAIDQGEVGGETGTTPIAPDAIDGGQVGGETGTTPIKENSIKINTENAKAEKE